LIPLVSHRLEGLAKLLDWKAVCSADVALMQPLGRATDLGHHALKGFAEAQAVFEMATAPG
jgi:adenylate cyclase